jgi:hypothetical protein
MNLGANNKRGLRKESRQKLADFIAKKLKNKGNILI